VMCYVKTVGRNSFSFSWLSLAKIEVLGSNNRQTVCQGLCCWNKHYVGGCTIE